LIGDLVDSVATVIKIRQEGVTSRQGIARGSSLECCEQRRNGMHVAAAERHACRALDDVLINHRGVGADDDDCN